MIELVLVVVAVSFLVLLIANLPSSISSVTRSRHTSLARNIASKEVENLRKQTYTNLVNGSDSFTDIKLLSLSKAAGTYIIEDCPETICTNGEQVKKITVKVSWNESGDSKTVELNTFISEGGISQ